LPFSCCPHVVTLFGIHNNNNKQDEENKQVEMSIDH